MRASITTGAHVPWGRRRPRLSPDRIPLARAPSSTLAGSRRRAVATSLMAGRRWRGVPRDTFERSAPDGPGGLPTNGDRGLRRGAARVRVTARKPRSRDRRRSTRRRPTASTRRAGRAGRRSTTARPRRLRLWARPNKRRRGPGKHRRTYPPRTPWEHRPVRLRSRFRSTGCTPSPRVRYRVQRDVPRPGERYTDWPTAALHTDRCANRSGSAGTPSAWQNKRPRTRCNIPCRCARTAPPRHTPCRSRYMAHARRRAAHRPRQPRLRRRRSHPAGRCRLLFHRVIQRLCTQRRGKGVGTSARYTLPTPTAASGAKSRSPSGRRRTGREWCRLLGLESRP